VTRLLRGLSDIADGYRLIMCDVWGVLHNGLRAFDGAKLALERFRANGGRVVLLTSSPNPSRAVAAQLDRLGVSRDAYDAIVSSGDVTVSLLAERAGASLFQIGPPSETALFEEVLAVAGKVPGKVPLKQAQLCFAQGSSILFARRPLTTTQYLSQCAPATWSFYAPIQISLLRMAASIFTARARSRNAIPGRAGRSSWLASPLPQFMRGHSNWPRQTVNGP
jgi:hypothetical protein